MERFTCRFEQESDALFNLVTKVVMPENAMKDLCEHVRYYRGKTISKISRGADKRTKSDPLGLHEEAKALHLKD